MVLGGMVVGAVGRLGSAAAGAAAVVAAAARARADTARVAAAGTAGAPRVTVEAAVRARAQMAAVEAAGSALKSEAVEAVVRVLGVQEREAEDGVVVAVVAVAVRPPTPVAVRSRTPGQYLPPAHQPPPSQGLLAAELPVGRQSYTQS